MKHRSILYIKAVSLARQVGVTLSSPGFDLGPVHVRCVIDEVSRGYFFLRTCRFFPVGIMKLMLIRRIGGGGGGLGMLRVLLYRMRGNI